MQINPVKLEKLFPELMIDDETKDYVVLVASDNEPVYCDLTLVQQLYSAGLEHAGAYSAVVKGATVQAVLFKKLNVGVLYGY